jgi:hypothetical protein
MITLSPRTTLALLILAAVALCAPATAQDTAKKEAKEETKAEPEKAKKASLAPLPIELPKAMFVGTPKNIRSPNLRRITGKKRAPFLAPKGAKNLAQEKEVTGSDDEPIIGEMELITDSDKEAADGSFVEFGPGLQHVQIDLGKICEIYAVVFWHYHSQARVYHDVVVRVSDDPDFIKKVKTLFNNDHDNSSGLGIGKQKEYIETNDGYLVDAKSAKGRYVRLYSRGNTSNELNHYIEVEVYGKPLE